MNLTTQKKKTNNKGIGWNELKLKYARTPALPASYDEYLFV